MRRRLLWLAVWLAGAVALGWGLWPPRHRPWPLPPGWLTARVPGTHFVDRLTVLDAGQQSTWLPAITAFERWDLDTGRRVSTRPVDPPLRFTPHVGGDRWHATVVPADSADGPTILVEWPTLRELVRHPGTVHLFLVGGPGDGLYAVGEPADRNRQPHELTPADLQPPRVVHIHDLATGRRLRTLPGASPRLPAVRDRRVVTITPREDVPEGVERRLHVWDVTDGRELCNVRYPAEQGTRDVYLSADGRTLLTRAGAAWDVATGAVRRQGDFGFHAVIPDGRWVVSVDDAGLVRWLDPATGVERVGPGRVPTASRVGDGTFNLNIWGDELVCGSAHWTPRPGRVGRWLTTTLPFLGRLVVGSERFETRLLDPATGRVVVAAPVCVYDGTDDGEWLFVDEPGGGRSLYYTGPLVPWAAGAAVAGWTALVVAVGRRRARGAT